MLTPNSNPILHPPATIATVEREMARLPHLKGDLRYSVKDTKSRYVDARRMKTAAEALGQFPAKNEEIHMTISGRFALLDYLPAILEMTGDSADEVRLTTLGFSKKNIVTLCSLLDTGRIGHFWLMASHYFKSTSKGIYEMAVEEFEKRPTAKFLSVRNHSKILLIRLADGKLSLKDEQTLDGILSRLAIPLDGVEKDVAILRDHARLTAAILPRAEIVAELAAVAKISDDYRDRETAALAALAADAQVINSRLSVANSRLKVAEKEGDDLEFLQGTHWQLLGRPDPEIESNKRHLFQTVFVQPTEARYEVVAFESLMSSPRDFARLLSSSSTAQWVALPGQTEAELQRLLGLARQLVTDGRPGRYVLPNTQADRVKFFTNLVLFADSPKRLKSDERFYIEDHNWFCAPGQSQDDFEKCVGAVTRKTVVNSDNLTTVQINETRQSSRATILQA